MDLSQLSKFLLDSNKAGYASEKSNSQQEPDGSTTITFVSSDFKSHDNFFGGEPYGGRVVVFYKEKPIWMMVYYGAVDDSIKNFGGVYGFLKKALMAMPENDPYRGPKLLEEGPYKYENSWRGNLESYSGEEKIYLNGSQIYWAKYIGGLVDQR